MSKKELLKRFIGVTVDISSDNNGFLHLKKAYEQGDCTLTGVGDDVFEISICSKKYYYSIAHVRSIEVIEI